MCPDESGVGTLAGLVSFGQPGCTGAGVYTKVSYYEDWITTRLRLEEEREEEVCPLRLSSTIILISF